MSVFEAGMMICFGVSWPIAAYKTYKCKCVHGKSFSFSLLILLGYACGITHKLLYSMDWVFWLYILNTLFLLLDMFLYLKYKNNEKTSSVANRFILTKQMYYFPPQTLQGMPPRFTASFLSILMQFDLLFLFYFQGVVLLNRKNTI